MSTSAIAEVRNVNVANVRFSLSKLSSPIQYQNGENISATLFYYPMGPGQLTTARMQNRGSLLVHLVESERPRLFFFLWHDVVVSTTHIPSHCSETMTPVDEIVV